jgi:hypothetical protein
VNEDGLPIIEFTEPVAQSRQRDFRIPSPPPLKPIPKTEAERIARRKENEAFFAALEEEEGEEAEKKNEREEESEFMRVIMEAKEKAREARTGENTRCNAGYLGKRTSNGSRSAGSDEEPEPSPKASNPTSKSKKAVKFADSADEKETSNTQTWGDVQQGRLRKPIGVKSGGDIMKLEIVEKFPSTSKARVVDSDDEDDSDSSEEGEEDEEEQRNQIEDALHQREIALRYHEMRQSLGTGPHGGALGGFVDPAATDEWDEEVSPFH